VTKESRIRIIKGTQLSVMLGAIAAIIILVWEGNIITTMILIAAGMTALGVLLELTLAKGSVGANMRHRRGDADDIEMEDSIIIGEINHAGKSIPILTTPELLEKTEARALWIVKNSKGYLRELENFVGRSADALDTEARGLGLVVEAIEFYHKNPCCAEVVFHELPSGRIWSCVSTEKGFSGLRYDN